MMNNNSLIRIISVPVLILNIMIIMPEKVFSTNGNSGRQVQTKLPPVDLTPGQMDEKIKRLEKLVEDAGVFVGLVTEIAEYYRKYIHKLHEFSAECELQTRIYNVKKNTTSFKWVYAITPAYCQESLSTLKKRAGEWGLLITTRMDMAKEAKLAGVSATHQIEVIRGLKNLLRDQERMTKYFKKMEGLVKEIENQ